MSGLIKEFIEGLAIEFAVECKTKAYDFDWDSVKAGFIEGYTEAYRQFKANEANKQPDTEALRLQNVVPSFLKKAFDELPDETADYRKTENGIIWKSK
jgi:hypothetical protein